MVNSEGKVTKLWSITKQKSFRKIASVNKDDITVDIAKKIKRKFIFLEGPGPPVQNLAVSLS